MNEPSSGYPDRQNTYTKCPECGRFFCTGHPWIELKKAYQRGYYDGQLNMAWHFLISQGFSESEIEKELDQFIVKFQGNKQECKA